MNTTAKVITFGIVSGLTWSVIPGSLNDLFQSSEESIQVVIAGLLTGVIVSLALKSPLKKFTKGWALIIGLLSLPFGAFIFGSIFSIIHSSDWSNAFQVGAEYAVISVISLFAVILFPLAVLTTFILRAIICSDEKQAG